MKLIKSIILIYTILTMLEWYIHKYLMHKTDNQFIDNINKYFKKIYKYFHNNEKQDIAHINHHKKVDTNGEVLEDEDGMYFDKNNVPLLFISAFIFYFVISLLLKFNHSKNEYKCIFIIFVIISVIYYKLWNFLHPHFHKYKSLDDFEISNNYIYNKLKKYHLLHHFNKGNNKCNFNIILPGADTLFNTYKGCVDNSDFCNDNSIEKSMNDIGLCDKQKNNIELPGGLTYCNNSKKINL